MRGQRHARRAGMVSAGTLALVLTSTASPAVADEGDDQRCEGGDGLLSTVTGVVCDTTGTLTDTTTDVLDETTGGATKDVGEEVTELMDTATDTVTDTVRDTVGQAERGDGGSPDTPPSDPDRSPDNGSDPADPADSVESADAGGDDGGDGADDGDSRGAAVGAAGSPADGDGALTRSGGGRFPHLQPLSPLADLDPGQSLDSTTTDAEPKLPKVAPSPTPSPSPTPPAGPEATQYAAPAGGEQPYDRGEATPALMVIFAIIAAGAVTGGHVAVAKARIRSRRVG